MKPIYTPKGGAKEYGNYALNIYTGCPHGCYYCFAPRVLHRNKEVFHSKVESRKDIVQATWDQLNHNDKLRGKLIHLCFSCDPYPTGYDTTVTREIIKVLKEFGNHVQILTKGDGSRDFDLLDSNDWYGVTISCDILLSREKEPFAISPVSRLRKLEQAKKQGIQTWVSFEPVIEAETIFDCLKAWRDYFDKVKVGKLNYYPSDINWKQFGKQVEAICKDVGVDYYIKDSLRKEMEGIM